MKKKEAFEGSTGGQAIQLLSIGAAVLPLLLYEYPEMVPWVKENSWPLPVGILPEEEGFDLELFSFVFGEDENFLLEKVGKKFPEELERFLFLCAHRLKWGNA